MRCSEILPASPGKRPANAATGWSLRTIARAGNGALAAIALFACGALVVLTTLMHGAFEEARTSAEASRAAEAARTSLLAYGRLSDLAYLTHEPRYELARIAAETDIRGRIDEVRRKARSDAARTASYEGAQRIDAYLASRHRSELPGRPLEEVLIAVTPQLDAALDAMDRLSDAELENVAEAEATARRWDGMADAIGVSVGVLLLLGSLVVAFVVDRFVLAPLFGLLDAIDHFGRGDRSSRVVNHGTAEFQRTATSFNHMAERIERQHVDMLTFLAGVAHDLRNPLAALRMSTDYLVGDGRPLPPEEKVRHTVALVGRQVSRLERMVGDFLDACRIESGNLELIKHERDLRELAREAVELYEPSSATHRLVLAVPEDPVVVDCDAERVGQVLNNLLSNAIKYSPTGGVVDVVVSREDGDAAIAIIDRGVGLAREDLDHIFEPFRRAGAGRDAIPGLGLGLSVSRRIVEAHGGRLDVKSELGVGSTFSVHLPRGGPASVEGPSLHHDRHDGQSRPHAPHHG